MPRSEWWQRRGRCIAETNVIELFFVLLVAASIGAWWQLMQGKLKARRAADHVCAAHDLQLLDDTVSLNSITWSREESGAGIFANYKFEFATNGARRRTGIATIGFPAKITVSLDMESGRLIEEF